MYQLKTQFANLSLKKIKFREIVTIVVNWGASVSFLCQVHAGKCDLYSKVLRFREKDSVSDLCPSPIISSHTCMYRWFIYYYTMFILLKIHLDIAVRVFYMYHFHPAMYNFNSFNMAQCVLIMVSSWSKIRIRHNIRCPNVQVPGDNPRVLVRTIV